MHFMYGIAMTKPPQFSRKCIFCLVNNANSREHFYSEWMHGLLPEFPERSYSGKIIDEHPKTGELIHYQKRVKPGHLHTKKIKAVCRSCNNEWMSAVESAAKPFLEPMIKGEYITLDASALAIVTRWATLKAIISEHDRPENAVTPQTDRTAFMEHGTIPSFFSIYILSHNCPARSGYMRRSQTISLTKDGPVPPLEGRQKNTQQISVILGSVFLYINAARVDNFRIEDWLPMPAVEAFRIWPTNRIPLSWPSLPVLTCKQIGDLAHSMDLISSLPQVRWGGELNRY